MKRLLLAVLALVGFGAIACVGAEVPPGHVGMCRTPDGFTGDILAPGRHACWGRDKMFLLETSDLQTMVHLNVLCADGLNFKFDVGVLSSVDKSKKDLVKQALENLHPDKGDAITGESIVKTYIAPVAESEVLKVVSKYTTAEIVLKQASIIEEIKAAVIFGTKDGLVSVKRVTVNNLDFPDSITKAQELKAQRQVEIETVKAEQEKRIIAAENDLKVADVEYRKQLVEAAMIADSNKIIASSVTPQFLAWWQLKVFGEAAKGPNNWGFIPYTDFAGTQLQSLNKWTSPEGVMDATLLKRIQDAKDTAKGTQTSPPSAQPQEQTAPEKSPEGKALVPSPQPKVK